MNPRLPTKVKTDGGDVKRSSFGEKMSSVWNSLGAPEDTWAPSSAEWSVLRIQI